MGYDDSILDWDYSTNFSKMVDEDIDKCDTFINSTKNTQEFRDFFSELVCKYNSYITGFSTGLYGYSGQRDYYDFSYPDRGELQDNIKAIKFKLIAFKNNNYKNCQDTNSNQNINIANNLTATQTQNINITFEGVKKLIEEMSGLSEEETNQTLQRVDEIKAIVELKESKKSKWQKIKPILTWIADKSVDVGIALLPLILKI